MNTEFHVFKESVRTGLVYWFLVFGFGFGSFLSALIDWVGESFRVVSSGVSDWPFSGRA